MVLLNETKIMEVLDHPNIVKFYKKWEDHFCYSYLIEMIQGEDLFNFVQLRKNLNEEEVKFIIKELLTTLEYIHNSGIVHRDIKPENIMVEYGKKINKIKIIDFGFSIFEEDISLMTPRCGTPNFIAPEIFLKHPYGTKSDIFSTGVIMYYLMTGYLPFDSSEVLIIQKRIVENDLVVEAKNFS